jgi:hypothetical protein
MDDIEIDQEVTSAINKWIELSVHRGRKLELTSGAKALIVQIIINIKQDRSPYWAKVDYDSVQRFAVSIIPNILVDMNNRYDLYRLGKEQVSSWEILHNISDALDKWCPIPKDI